MAAPVSERHLLNTRGDSGPGIREENLHGTSGLRLKQLSYSPESNLGLLVGPAVTGATSLSNVDVTTLVGGAMKLGGWMPTPGTLCFTYQYGVASASARVVQFTVTGYDIFGNHIREVLPAVTLENGITMLYTEGGAMYSPRAYQWSSKCFALVEEILISGSNLGATDVFSVGTNWHWDKATGTAVIYHDRTGGDFRLDVTIDGATSTSGVIDAANNMISVQNAIEATANINRVAVHQGNDTDEPAGLEKFFVVEFIDPVIDHTALTVVSDTTTGGSIGVIVTGDQFFGQENVGMAAPLELLSGGASGAASNAFPEVVGGSVEVEPKHSQRTFDLGPANTIAAVSVGAPGTGSVVLTNPHQFGAGEELFIYFDGGTGVKLDLDAGAGTTAADLSGVIFRCPVLQGGTDQRRITVGLPVTITSQTAPLGTAYIIRDPQPLKAYLQPAPGTRSVPSGAGVRLGVSASGYAGDPNKVQIYTNGLQAHKLTDSSEDTRAVSLAESRPSGGYPLQAGKRQRIDVCLKTTAGTGRDPVPFTYPS